jgi:signal transduction histidine kinase
MRSRFSPSSLKLLSGRSILSFGLLLALAVILVLLAALQYRWSGEVSEAERGRLQKSLDSAAQRFQEEFYRAMVQVCAAFGTEPVRFSRESRDQFVQQYKNWAQTASHPQLVANVFLWKSGTNGDPALLLLNQTSMRFEAVDWPDKFEALRRRLTRLGPPDPRRPDGPQPPPFAWTIAEEVPALVHPLFWVSGREPESRLVELHPWGYLIVELNLKYLQSVFFPSLVQRVFGGPGNSSYQVKIVVRSQPPRVIYPPDLEGAGKELLAGDAVVDLLRPGPENSFPVSLRGQRDGPERDHDERILRVEPGWAASRDFARRPRGPRFPPLLTSNPEGSWQLVAKHKSGSLEAVVAANRRRNLGISFGILLLLGVSAVMVFVSTMRARHLARLQMEFVAAVSHELRTPLAVIRSAAHNLAAGIVSGKEQTQRYGTLIQSEGMRLSRMVQQILLFASGQAGRTHHERRAVQIADIIDSVLADSVNKIEAAGFCMEKQIEPDLPPVLADPDALGHCLQNLVSNALKYGGDRRWMGVRARRTHGAGGPEVQVIVEDKGLGIEAEELKDVFKPFYRSKSVTTAQIPGTGLGLSVAKSVAEAMGGTLRVKSMPGQGSTFTLHLPVLKQVDQPARPKAG